MLLFHLFNKILLEIRGKTDETGVEYPFAMVGNLGDINGDNKEEIR